MMRHHGIRGLYIRCIMRVYIHRVPSIEIFSAHHGFKCNVMNDDTYPTNTSTSLNLCRHMYAHAIAIASIQSKRTQWNGINETSVKEMRMREEKKETWIHVVYRIVCIQTRSIPCMAIMEGLQYASALLSYNIHISSSGSNDSNDTLFYRICSSFNIVANWIWHTIP